MRKQAHRWLVPDAVRVDTAAAPLDFLVGMGIDSLAYVYRLPGL